MATIAELIIAASVDARGMKEGFDEGGRYARDFGKNIESELDQLGKGASTSGMRVAEAILEGANTTFRQRKLLLTEQLLAGTITEQQFKTQGANLARAFNASLAGGLTLLRTELGRNEVNGLASLEMLTGAYKREGIATGRAYATAVASGIREGSAGISSAGDPGGMGWPGRARTTGLMIGGRNAAPALVAGAYGMESLVRSATAAEGGIRAATRSLATFAAGFGVGGVLVTAVITAGQALYDFWNKQATLAKEAREKVQKEMAQLANAGDAAGITKKARDLYFGVPYKEGSDEPTAASKHVSGAFKGSLADLRGELTALQDQFYATTNGFVQQRIQRQIIEVKRELAPMEDMFRRIGTASANLLSQPSAAAGQLLGVTITERSPLAKPKKEPKPFKDLTEDVKLLTEAIRLAEERGERAGDVIYSRLIAKRREIAGDLATEKPGKGRNALLGADNDAMEALGLTTAKVIERYHTLTDASSVYSRESMDAMGAIQSRLDTVGAKIREQGGLTRASSSLIREQTQLYGALEEAMSKIITHVPAAPTSLYDQLAGRVQRVKSMDATADAMQSAGVGGAGEASAAAQSAREKLTESLRAYLGVERQANESQAEYETRMERISALWDELNGKAPKAVDVWSAMREGIQGVIDSAAGLGIIDSNLAKAANGALHMVSALKQVAAVKKANDAASAADKAAGGSGGAGIMGMISTVSAGMGVIGAGISIASGIAGMLSQHDETLERNNHRLQELREAMANPTGLQGMQTAIDTISAWSAQRGGFGGSSGNGNQGLDAMLKQAGITPDQFEKMRKDLGIESGKGMEWIRSFSEAMALAITAARKFGAGLDDQTALAQLRLKVYEKDTPQDAMESTLGILRKFAPKLAAGFDGIDTATAEGQQKLKTALQALFERMASGDLTAGDYGTLGGAKDLAGIIGTLMDSLGALSKSASTTAASLLYVPAGYKVALARFDAMDAVVPEPLKPSGPTDRGGQVPGDPVDPIQQVQGRGAGGTGGGITITGDIYVDAQQMSSDELFANVLKTAQRKAVTQFGRSSDWARVQSA